MKRITILGGSHDGQEYALSYQHELRMPRLLPITLNDYGPEYAVSYEIEVYGPATELDELLGRWSLLRVEKS